MRLNLAKIEVALLQSVKADPSVIGTILFAPGQTTAGFSADYRILSAVAEGRAEAEHKSARWKTFYPWLAAATGEDGENDVVGTEFGYGPGFLLDPGQVVAIAHGLMGEGWGVHHRSAGKGGRRL
ncbi:hypothetical protein Ssi02_77920 [Sinosporangium siamense]|uniref:Uncharacterized protein n=2 Tax=Sinosporangium siamense TaxID=1367973 RepID=A0A919VBG2_9ACTN|nr:hypothetical protein Ssi02_77920 [Sinosporangium siamense]